MVRSDHNAQPGDIVGKPDLDFDPSAFIRSSWGLHDINQTVTGVAAALVNQLSGQAGMAGGDDAGADFARLYYSAADGTIDGIAHAANPIGGGSRVTFRAAITFMAKDAELAARLRNQGLLGAEAGSGGERLPECDTSPLGQAAALPAIRGTTSTVDRWVWGELFRGSPDKLRSVAGTWRMAQRITARTLEEVQDCWKLVKPARGQTAKATNDFFTQLCGYEPASPEWTTGHRYWPTCRPPADRSQRRVTTTPTTSPPPGPRRRGRS